MLKTILRKQSAAFSLPLGILWALSLLSAAPSHADLSYTLTTSISGAGGSAFTPPTIKTTFLFKGDQQRVDSSITSPMFSRKTSTITNPATGKVINIDSALKIYDVDDLTNARPDLFGVSGAGGGGFGRGGGRRGRRGQGGQGGGFGGGQGAAPNAAGGQGGPGGPRGGGGPEDRADETGTVTVNVSVVDRGDSPVGDVDAHHYSITTTETGAGTVRVDPNPNTLDVWVDSTPRPMSAAVRNALNGTTLPGAKVNYVYTGDVDLLKTALAGVPVRIRIISQRGDTIEVDRTSLSTAKLSPSLFAPPAADKEVAPADYATQERAAMRSRFGGGGRRGGGGGFGGGQGGPPNGGGAPPPPAPNNN